MSAPSTELIVLVGTVACMQPPGAPSRLTSSVTGTSVLLTWQAAASGCPATSYSLEVGSFPGANNLGVFPSAANQLSASAVGIGIYFVRVRGLNAFGTSDVSNEAIVSVGQTAPPIESACTPFRDPSGFVSDSSNVDAFGGISFISFLVPLPHGCRIANANAGAPVRDGMQSLRFELRPGDCDVPNGDCQTSRSRYEIQQQNRGSTDGRVLTYELWLYVPPQPRFRPKGGNIMFLNQLHYMPADREGGTGTLAYLEVGANNELIVRTHIGFTTNIQQQYTVLQNPVGAWNKIVWEIGSTSQASGFLRVYVNDVLKVDETKPTLPAPLWRNALKIGLYNAFISDANEPFETQIVYFDGLRRSVR